MGSWHCLCCLRRHSLGKHTFVLSRRKIGTTHVHQNLGIGGHCTKSLGLGQAFLFPGGTHGLASGALRHSRIGWMRNDLWVDFLFRNLVSWGGNAKLVSSRMQISAKCAVFHFAVGGCLALGSSPDPMSDEASVDCFNVTNPDQFCSTSPSTAVWWTRTF